ncbi:MAG: DVUA0089 family protein [Pseudomonadota bacterium]
MKLFKLLLASLAFVAVSAQANTISTTVLVDNNPSSDTVQYVNFYVTNAGEFDISANSTFFNGLSDPYIYLFSSPVNSGNFIASDDDGGSGDNARIDDIDLAIGSYVVALSNFNFTFSEALSGYNASVTNGTEGWAEVIISSRDGTASFTAPSAVPVPAAAWLFGSALMGFAGFRRKSV